jgi:hypothetical protein
VSSHVKRTVIQQWIIDQNDIFDDTVNLSALKLDTCTCTRCKVLSTWLFENSWKSKTEKLSAKDELSCLRNRVSILDFPTSLSTKLIPFIVSGAFPIKLARSVLQIHRPTFEKSAFEKNNKKSQLQRD